MKVNSNMTSFFHFVNKRAIYLDGKISLAHLNQVIKSQNKIIYTDVSDLNIFFYWSPTGLQLNIGFYIKINLIFFLKIWNFEHWTQTCIWIIWWKIQAKVKSPVLNYYKHYIQLSDVINWGLKFFYYIFFL
jgi:hypothetical protein